MNHPYSGSSHLRINPRRVWLSSGICLVMDFQGIPFVSWNLNFFLHGTSKSSITDSNINDFNRKWCAVDQELRFYGPITPHLFYTHFAKDCKKDHAVTWYIMIVLARWILIKLFTFRRCSKGKFAVSRPGSNSALCQWAKQSQNKQSCVVCVK